MDSGGQFIHLYKWVPVWTVVDSSLSCINEYLAMDRGGQFIQLYKWVPGLWTVVDSSLTCINEYPGYGQWWTVHSAV